MIVQPSIVDDDISALAESEFVQFGQEGLVLCGHGRRIEAGADKADPDDLACLLPPRVKRPSDRRRRRAAEKGDELAPVHSITSSARNHSGRPPNMNTTPAQLETPRPTPARYLV